jgi:hypothetical protein
VIPAWVVACQYLSEYFCAKNVKFHTFAGYYRILQGTKINKSDILFRFPVTAEKNVRNKSFYVAK